MPPTLTKDEVCDMMLLLDSDGDGEISKAEFGTFFRRAHPMSDAEYEKLWESIDRNGDGSLQFEELCLHYKLDFSQTQEDLKSAKDMDDDMILQALQLQTVLLEERQKREQAEAEAKKKANFQRSATGVRPGITVLKISNSEFLTACELGDLEDVSSQLFDDALNVRIEDEKAESPLHKLAKWGAHATFRTIMERVKTGHGEEAMLADLNATDKNGWTPLMHAVANSEKIAAKANPAKDAIKLIADIVDRGAELDIDAATGWRCLHVAAHNDALTAMQTIFQSRVVQRWDLMKKRAFVNAEDNQSRTALHIAAFRAGDAIVQFLLDQGADPSSPDAHGSKPATLAHKCGRSRSKELIELHESNSRRASKEEMNRTGRMSKDSDLTAAA